MAFLDYLRDQGIEGGQLLAQGECLMLTTTTARYAGPLAGWMCSPSWRPGSSLPTGRCLATDADTHRLRSRPAGAAAS